MDVTVRLNPASQRQFNATLERYLQYSKRTLSEALNEKAYFILNGGPDTTGAIKLTHKADHERIKRELGASMQSVVGKRGKALKRKKLGFDGAYWNTLAVKIIIARLRKAGDKIPDAATMQKMALDMVRARVRSVAFIRSGWLPALRKFARFSKYTRIGRDEAGKQVGAAKGGASIATPSQGWRARAVLWNSAGGESKHRDAIIRYGEPALNQAVRDEMSSMVRYIERKMTEGARRLGIKVRAS